MGKKFGEFKFNIGDIIFDEKRNLLIIDKYYRQANKHKNGKCYTQNEKWYRYKCLKCGNEDEIIEYSLYGSKRGCNACCNPPRKIVKGINDISTTASWMMKYIVDEEYCYSNAKYSKEKTLVKCPNCGRTTKTTAYMLYACNGLPCVCGDGYSFPNKLMYSLLDQININFEKEKVFPWSEGKIYDFYIIHNEKKIICELNGLQHYDERVGWKNKPLEFEIRNDEYKRTLAINNGIDLYYQINASTSNLDFIKDNIIKTGLLKILNVDPQNIDWIKCGIFATSNLYKLISEYHEKNPILTCNEVASHFKLSRETTFKAINAGIKYGWCNITFKDSKKIRENHNIYNHGIKPIYCQSTGMCYRSVRDACEYLTENTGVYHSKRVLAQYIRDSKEYKGNKYIYITYEEFNKLKSKFPDKCYGDFFNIKENVA